MEWDCLGNSIIYVQLQNGILLKYTQFLVVFFDWKKDTAY